MSDTSVALLVIDVQNDFCSGGALAVPGGDRIIPRINRLLAVSSQAARPVFASRDWHPIDSTHFSEHGGNWPVHCIAETIGAAFHPNLMLGPDAIVVTKGSEPDADGYSAFDGITPTGASLRATLKALNLRHLVLCGLATDYCVRASVVDAMGFGFDVSLVQDAIAAVNREAGDGDAAVRQLRSAGANIVGTDDALALLDSND